MDVSGFIVGLMVICLGSMSTQLPQSDHSSNAATMDSNNTAYTATRCATARGVPGSCVDRQYCDYSTYAIDLSLFAPKGYKKLCLEKEVCCPFTAQIQTIPDAKEPRKPSWEDTEQSLADDE